MFQQVQQFSYPISFKSSSADRKKHIFFYTDLDGTLLHYQHENGKPDRKGLSDAIRVIHQFEEKRNVTVDVAIATGRSLLEMQHYPMILQALKKLKVHYFISGNGQQIFVNRQHQPFEVWIKRLKHEQQDMFWRNAITAISGWKLDTVGEVIEKTLHQFGFQKITSQNSATEPILYRYSFENQGQAIVEYYRDQAAITIRSMPGTSVTAFHQLGKKLTQRVQQVLSQEKQCPIAPLAFAFREYTPQGETIEKNVFFFGPKGISKASALRYLATHYIKNADAFITAGDRENDLKTLSAPQYILKNGQTIKNYPILAGTDETMLHKLKKLFLLQRVPNGYLAKALEKHFQDILKT